MTGKVLSSGHGTRRLDQADRSATKFIHQRSFGQPVNEKVYAGHCFDDPNWVNAGPCSSSIRSGKALKYPK